MALFFGFDDEQEEFRATVEALLDAQCPAEFIRDAWSAPPGELDRGPWSHLVDIGVVDLLVSGHAGGLGLDERSVVLVLQEAGRFAVPLPIVETVCVAPVLPGWTAGGPMVSTDLGGPNVPMAADVDALLLLDRSTHSLHLVPRADVALTPVLGVDRARRLATVDWTPSADTLATDDPTVVERAVVRGVFATSAMLVGLIRRMIDMTVDYVKQRQQFGVAIGSFQAIKHKIADALVDWSFARPLVHQAAWALSADSPDMARDVSMAKAMASDAAIRTSRMALQCHGAIGYTVEHDLHLFLKRAHAMAAAWGDAAHHRQLVGQSLGLTSIVTDRG